MLEVLALELDTRFAVLGIVERLKALRQAIPGRIVFTTSLGLEDQVLTHLVAENDLEIELATLDTGRLFPETYDLWAATEERYGRRIKAFAPSAPSLEALLADQGVNGFRYGVEMRKACCHVRKVEPLGRALAGASAWITGLRADQSATRATTSFASVDPTYRLIKANPLLDQTRDALKSYAEAHAIPVNALHDKGFLSIGCAPCTRALKPGEPERAGRWWWEDEAQKECGLHVAADGKLERTKTEVAA
jgi:phosphoadenosine phosphosulfate reductase